MKLHWYFLLTGFIAGLFIGSMGCAASVTIPVGAKLPATFQVVKDNVCNMSTVGLPQDQKDRIDAAKRKLGCQQ